jgi:quercetin dioxygenase-like cupin family protein
MPAAEFESLARLLEGQYALERKLGGGGMGIVYLARDLRLERPVAIRTLPPSLADNALIRERFIREARTAAKRSHPNIVPIHRADEIEGHVFFVWRAINRGRNWPPPLTRRAVKYENLDVLLDLSPRPRAPRRAPPTGERPCVASSPTRSINSEDPMKITRSGSQPSAKGAGDWFTGTVRIDPLFGASAPARAAGNAVTFEPGARTAWHTHPLGQALIVTFGGGWVQCEGGPIEEIRPGDVVWFDPGEKHWHGASAAAAMQHIAINEALDGKAVEWLEHVSDEQYQRGRGTR